jgi:uncharacterized C2H2 Zn-finger protein
MPKKKLCTANKSTQKKPGQEMLKCPWCPIWYHHPSDYHRHIRSHPQFLNPPPKSPPNKLLSRRSADVSDGIFDFGTILDDGNGQNSDAESEPNSDDNSYFSDYRYDRESSSDDNDDILTDKDNVLNDDGADDDSNMSFILVTMMKTLMMICPDSTLNKMLMTTTILAMMTILRISLQRRLVTTTFPSPQICSCR